MKHLKDEFGQEVCPYCGAPLMTRRDYRTHLTLKSCQSEPHLRRGYPEGWDEPDEIRRDVRDRD